MTLASMLASQVPETIRYQGQECFRSGAVKLESVNTRSVRAIILKGDDCDVDLDLEGRTLYAFCNCRYAEEHGKVCKHIWATVLAADGRGLAHNASKALRLVVDDSDDEFGDGHDEYDDYDDPPLSPFRTFLPHTPANQRSNNDWKKQLDTLSREVQPASSDFRQSRPTAERQLIFIVDVPVSEVAKKLVLEVNIQERKKNNEWGKPKSQSLPTGQIEALPNPLDRQILTLLSGADRGDSYGYYGGSYYGYGVLRYRLAGPLLETVLPLLAASGRVRLRRSPKLPVTLEDVVPDLEPPWQLRVGVTRDDKKKKWVLAGNLQRNTRTMLLSEPTLIVPGLVFWEGRFSRLDTTNSFPWVPVLRRVGTIEVPIKLADEFLGQLLQMPHLPKLDLPEELHYTEEVVLPRPKLVVKAGKQHYNGPMLNAELSFDYAGQTVPAGEPGRGVFKPEGKQFVVRDSAAEHAASQWLSRLGFRPGWSGRGQILELKAAVLPKVVRELTAAGWQVEAEGKLYRHAGEFKLAVHTERDWFDLDATADFEGNAVPLPRLLAALKRGDTSIVLDDGSLGMVPEEWLKKYGLIARMGTVEGDHVRFGRGPR